MKARRRARYREQMASRLAAVAAKAEAKEEKRQRSIAAGAALTSLMPGINAPRATLDAVIRQAGRVHGPQRRGPHGTGPHGTGPRGTGPQHRPAAAGPGPARQRCEQPARSTSHGAEAQPAVQGAEAQKAE